MFSRLIAKLSGAAIRNANRFRPQVEGLEAREVPAGFGWMGMVSSDAYDPDNWSSLTPGALPGPSDDVNFGQNATPDWMTMNRPCDGFGTAGAYHGVYVNNKYSQTITLASGFVTADLYLQARPTGAISQPTSGTDITVTREFLWTGGILNSDQSHSATLTLDGATAWITPANAGTLTTNDTLNFINGSTGTFNPGTLNATGAVGIIVSAFCSVDGKPPAAADVTMNGPVSGIDDPKSNIVVKKDGTLKAMGSTVNNDPYT